MAEELLFRSHSISKNNNEISGSLTLWEDTPNSPYDVGDIFQPFEDAPLMYVNRVNISDDVIGKWKNTSSKES